MPASFSIRRFLRQPTWWDSRCSRRRSFPEGNIFTRNSFAPRLGISYDFTGKGSTVLKGFYGRYYYNYADAFSSLNPAGANYKTFKFNDLDKNGVYSGPQELGQFQASAGGTTTTVDPDMKKPYADEFDASVEHQFWGESSCVWRMCERTRTTSSPRSISHAWATSPCRHRSPCR